MIKVINPGFYTTVQDLGRFGYRDKGVPVSGAMDDHAANLANAFLGNDPGAALLEMTMTGPELIFEEPSSFAISGAIMSPTLNGKDISNNRVYDVEKGDTLKFGRLQRGFRGYLSFKGGLDTEVVLGSRSWYYPLTTYSHVQKGFKLPVIGNGVSVKSDKKLHDGEVDFNETRLKVYKGPEFDLLNGDQIDQLTGGVFTVGKENNRMAYQLNENIYPHKHSILTSATRPGTVQFTPSGKIIILMKDAQTTGGYPRIFQMSEEAIQILAQKKTGEEVVFETIEL